MIRQQVRTSMREEEYQAFIAAFKNSAYRKKSQYCKALLLGKPVKVLYRNRSMDELVEMGVGLRKDLRRLLSEGMPDNTPVTEISSKLASIEAHLIKLVELCGPIYTPRKMC